jgi:hypothetical protein
MFISPDEINDAVKKEDVYVYEDPNQKNDSDDEENNQRKKTISDSNKINSWMQCLKRITPLERTRYCQNEFNSLSNLQKKCEVNPN